MTSADPYPRDGGRFPVKLQERGVEFSFPNCRSGDPLIYGFNHRTGEAFLFDLGSLERMARKKLLKISKIFVSHTHIDHFVGFDRLLRVNVPHRRVLEFCGPPGIVANIQGKLAGYAWNLLARHQIRFVIHELQEPAGIASYKLQFEDGFKLYPYEDFPHPDGTVTTFKDGARIKATLVDHGIPVASYRLCFPPKYHVRSEELAKHDLRPGPWLKRLLAALDDRHAPATMKVEGKTYRLTWLKDNLLDCYPEFSVSYLTDLRFCWENLVAVKKLHHNTALLFCESAFSAADYRRAIQKSHLSTRQCALLASWVGSQRLENFHFSKIYSPRTHTLRTEAVRYLTRYRQLPFAQLCRQIEREIALCQTC